uniref:Uncharacterized protein n=1 Tax=Timema bartmani TaxID=61472 RepID=A0A7R9F7V0_9NEOP|nr:unnamed protein product [Timema bartmani]
MPRALEAWEGERGGGNQASRTYSNMLHVSRRTQKNSSTSWPSVANRAQIQDIDGGFFEKFGSLLREHQDRALEEEYLPRTTSSSSVEKNIKDEEAEEEAAPENLPTSTVLPTYTVLPTSTVLPTFTDTSYFLCQYFILVYTALLSEQ